MATAITQMYENHDYCDRYGNKEIGVFHLSFDEKLKPKYAFRTMHLSQSVISYGESMHSPLQSNKVGCPSQGSKPIIPYPPLTPQKEEGYYSHSVRCSY